MSDELKRLEVELARVRLAKEQLELHDALQRADRKQRLANTADTLVDAGRRAAKSSAAVVAQRTPSAPVAWSKIVVIAGLALLMFFAYVAGLPDSKSNPLVIAFFAAAALTLRSSRLAPAWHLAREALVLIIRLAGQAPHLRSRLSSNVRPHQAKGTL